MNRFAFTQYAYYTGGEPRSPYRSRVRAIWALLMLVIFPGAAGADEVSVAVAINFRAPMERIAAAFQKDSGQHLSISYGATGKLYAQIKNGAPFAVLLSADAATPMRLATEAQALARTRFTYAIGKLVLWSPDPNLVDARGQVLHSDRFRFLAVANAKLAPYGFAAQEVLQRLRLWPAVERRLVRGENIAQTYQFVVSGNAQLGFVAMSQIKTPHGMSGSYWLVPQNLYTPIEQQAILLRAGKDSIAAQAFLRYLKGAAARAIIADYGYGLDGATH